MLLYSPLYTGILSDIITHSHKTLLLTNLSTLKSNRRSKLDTLSVKQRVVMPQIMFHVFEDIFICVVAVVGDGVYL